MNFKSLKAALGQAVSQGASYAKDLSTQVTGAKILRDYTLGTQTGSGGPGCLWKIHSARCKREGAANALVSVWFLDKRPPEDMRHASSQRAWEDFLELCRKDAANLTRLKHPGIVKLVEPFEETRTQMVLLTEPIILSLANALSGCAGLPFAVVKAHEELKMSELERKHGLLQVADTLQFLHAEANLIHCALAPEALFLTGAGPWKLASLAFCSQVEYAVGESSARTFEYEDVSPAGRLLAPPLGYVAPELIANGGGNSQPLSPAADMFSLGCMAYELLADRALMPPRCSKADHQARIAGMALMDLEPVNLAFQPVLRSLLSGTASVRPSATSFMGAGYFQDDVLVRSLRFLDNLLQRDNLQKAAFLKDAIKMWPRFDARVLRYKVLPPLLAELRNEALQALVLPLVLNIIPQQSEQDFLDWTLPALLPITSSAKGESLLILTRNAALLASTMPPEAVKKLIVPLLVRAADQGDAQAQEEMVKAVPMLAEIIMYEDLKTELLPRVCGLCLSTTSAGVRTGALMAMGKLLPSIEVEEAKKMMTICGKVTTVDQSPGTVMCVIGLGTAVAKQFGPETGARASLPVMGPCLAAPTLTPQQYSTAMRSVREILAALDAQKGVSVTVAGSQASSSNSLSTLDTAGAPSPRTAAKAAAQPPKASPLSAAKQSPTGGAIRASTLADAFSFADDVSPTTAVPAMPAAAAAAATDDMFDFQPINRGGSASSPAGQWGPSAPMAQPMQPSSTLGALPGLPPPPVAGASSAQSMGLSQSMGMSQPMGTRATLPKPPSAQPAQHPGLSSAFGQQSDPFGGMQLQPPTANTSSSAFDSLI